MSRRVLASTLGSCAVLLAGVAGAPAATALATDGPVLPPGLDVGAATVFTSHTRDITVSVPPESATVTFPAVAATVEADGAAPGVEDFSVVADHCAGEDVTPRGTCTVTVGFDPFDVGARQAVLRLESTSPATSQTVALTGTGTPDATGTYYGISPTRFLDTRKDGTKRPLARSSTTTVRIGGRSGIPTAGVSAVVLNLTAVTTTAQGYFTVYPSNRARPTVSSINFPKGWTGANMVTVPVSPDGTLKLYNNGGAAHAIIDVLGWYAEDDSVRAATGMGTQFLPADEKTGDAQRRYDSRTDPDGAFAGGGNIQFEDTWASPEDAAAVKSYVVNVTAVDATSEGVLTLWQGGTAKKPTVSSVNYVKGTVAPNMAVVPAGHYSSLTSGFKLQNTGSGEVDVVVDEVGYYLADRAEGLRFVPRATPKRLVDTRKPLGPDTVLSGAFGAGARTVKADSVTGPDSYFVVANTTGILPTRRTYVTVWSGEAGRPSASNLNVNAGVVRSASTYAPLRFVAGPPEAFSFKVYNDAGSMHLALDVAGTFDAYPGSAATAPAGVAAAESTRSPSGRLATTRRDAPHVDTPHRDTVRH
jgi:hypothetical protein